MCKNVRYFQGFGRAITEDYSGSIVAKVNGNAFYLCNEEELNYGEYRQGFNAPDSEWNEVKNDIN